MKTTAPPAAVYLSPESSRTVRNRLRRLSGHAAGIERMLEEGRSCDEILVQMAAPKEA